MKRLKLLIKTLLVTAGLGVGASAWAYDTPDGYGVSKVFIGTAGSANANGIVTTVTEEDFESTEVLGSEWDKGTLVSNQSINLIDIVNIEEVVKPEEGATPVGVPTYVSGKAFRAHYRDSGGKYATFTLGKTVSSGKIVFNGDLFMDDTSESYHNYDPQFIQFDDDEGNNVLKTELHKWFSFLLHV